MRLRIGMNHALINIWDTVLNTVFIINASAIWATAFFAMGLDIVIAKLAYLAVIR